MEKTSLYYKNEGSDKEYHVTLDGETVTVQYGRRGSALTSITKCEKCEPAKALKVYQQLIAEKKAKGYHEGEGGVTYSPSVNPEYVGYQPQLLNEITEDVPDKWIQDNNWLMQEKEDGRNIGVILKDGKAVAANKKGLAISIPERIIKDIESSFMYDLTLCGELVGNIFKVWDIIDCSLLPSNTNYIRRYYTIRHIIGTKNPNIQVTRTAITMEEKIVLFNEMHMKNAEGVVFKRKNSLYHPGRPNSGGDQLKFKFTATCSVIIGEQNVGKRSVEMRLFDADITEEWVSVGNVTIYPNQEIPLPNQIAEIKYLYAYRGGSLFQPVFKEIRTDVASYECTTSQLKYKREIEEE